MSIWKISLQNLKSKPIYTFLSVITLALSIVLLLAVKQIKASFEYQMKNNLGDIDLVIGAKGSPLQLVLASVLHLDNPTGNISFAEAKKITKTPIIKNAVPISYGDNYKGFRIVGTTPNFKSLYYADLEIGNDFKGSFEAVIGHTVAQQTKLSIGDTFVSSHGLIESEDYVHEEKFTVVGILKPTQKVIDNLILTHLESIWDIHNHEGQDHENHEDEDKMITSMLISFRNPAGFLTFPRMVNKHSNMQASLPKFELEKLYDFTGIGLKAITLIAYLILVISGLTIFINLYKMVKERAFDLALLRTYGATPFQLVRMVAYEGLVIFVLAFTLSIGLIKLAFPALLNTLELEIKSNLLQELAFQEILQIGVLVLVISGISILIAVYPITQMRVSEILRDEK